MKGLTDQSIDRSIVQCNRANNDCCTAKEWEPQVNSCLRKVEWSGLGYDKLVVGILFHGRAHLQLPYMYDIAIEYTSCIDRYAQLIDLNDLILLIYVYSSIFSCSRDWRVVTTRKTYGAIYRSILMLTGRPVLTQVTNSGSS